MKYNIEKIFVFLALIFGLLYVFILPPFQSVDEGNHFFRTYQISTGRFISKNIAPKGTVHDNYSVGDDTPISIIKYWNDYEPMIKHIDEKQTINNIKRDFSSKLNPDNKKFYPFANTSLYSPVCYISQLPGVIIAEYFTDNLAVIYYSGRLCNLLIYCLLIFWALRVIPFYKLPMMLLALCPMSLSLAASYTCDVAVLGLNFLWIAYILRFLTQEYSDKYKTSVLAILAFLITLTKSYVLLLPLCFLLPVKKYKNLRNYLLSMSCIVSAIFLSAFIWYLCSHGLTLNMNNTVADSASQIEFIKSHPIEYILILIKTFIIKTPRLIITMIGVLGWQDTKLDWSTYILYPVMIYYSIFSDGFRFKLALWQKLLIMAIILTGTILTYTSLYIMWSPVANPLILGLNGKYFIPMMLPLFLLFKGEYPKYDYNNVVKFTVIALVLILFTSELSLLHRFYNITPQLYYKI